MSKILKYNRNNVTIDLFGRTFTNTRVHNRQPRKNQKNFFRPRIDIIHNELNKFQTNIPIELYDDNITGLQICIWLLKIRNNKDKFLRYSSDITNCECMIEIIKNERPIEKARLCWIDIQKLKPNLIHSNNKEINFDEVIRKYCISIEKNMINQDMSRGTLQQLPFIITLKNTDFFYLLEKQDTTFEYNEGNFIDETYTINPKKLRFDKYEVDIKVNCNERKEERGKRYILNIDSWQNVGLVKS